MFFFGGGWKNGNHTQFTSQAEYFASRGLVLRFRGLPDRVETQRPRRMRASRTPRVPMRYVRGPARPKLGVDADRDIVSAGGSAGGHLAAAVAMVPGFDAAGETPSVSCKPNAMVLVQSGVERARTMWKSKTPTGRTSPQSSGRTTSSREDAPPCIIFFGTDDKLGEGGKKYIGKAKPLGVQAEAR